MKTIAIKCPNCNSSLDTNSKFCPQCGTPVAIQDETKMLQYTYQKVDDARIREADVHEAVRLKELELELYKLQNETKQKKINLGIRFAVVFLLLATMIGLIIAGQSNGELNVFALLIVIVLAIATPIMFRNRK